MFKQPLALTHEQGTVVAAVAASFGLVVTCCYVIDGPAFEAQAPFVLVAIMHSGAASKYAVVPLDAADMELGQDGKESLRRGFLLAFNLPM